MQYLISKLQLHYFEQGDFDKIEKRNLEETLAFIHQFPWEEQRNGIFINLNGPSVTIENGKGAYLKIGVYYHGKFILYYLNEDNRLYCRIVDRLTEADQSVKEFFDNHLNEKAFNKYREWISGKRKYFETGRFEYRFSFIRTVILLNLSLILGPMLLALLISYPKIEIALYVLPVFMLFSGISLMLAFNYYFFSRNLYLKVSRGVNEFYFGEKGNVREYSKKDIRTIRTFNNKKWSKCPWGEFYTFEIEMRYGEVLPFTNLMISSGALGEKFPEVIINDKHRAIPVARKLKTITKTI